MKKNKIIIITIIILVVIVASAIGGYFVYKHTEDQKPIEQGWANTYYNYIKKDSNGNIQDNSKLSFIEVENIQEPVMLVEYSKENKTNTDIYYINDGTVKNIIDLGITDVELLYDISNQKYDWYTHKETESADTYIKVSSQITGETTEKSTEPENAIENNTENTENTVENTTTNNTELSNTTENANTANSTESANTTENTTETDGEYTFAKGEEITEDNTDGSKISIPKFDTIFVKADTDLDKIDYKKDMEDKELKTALAEGANKYKTEDEIITDEIKAETAQKVTEVEQKKQEIEKIKQEKAIAEEEARKKAEEEEAKRKAEEEAQKGIQAGNYTLKYGTYKGTEAQYDVTGILKAEITITLKQDGTYTLKSSNASLVPNSSGTYKIEKNTYAGMSGTHLLQLSSGNMYSIIGNNTFEIPAGSGGTFTYQGN